MYITSNSSKRGKRERHPLAHILFGYEQCKIVHWNKIGPNGNQDGVNSTIVMEYRFIEAACQY